MRRTIITTDEAIPNGGKGYFPQDIKRLYNIPDGLTGEGQTIGILEFTNGYNLRDAEQFWRLHGIPSPLVTFVSVDGTPNDGGRSADDAEATLDLQWAGAIAPGAHIIVYGQTRAMLLRISPNQLPRHYNTFLPTPNTIRPFYQFPMVMPRYRLIKPTSADGVTSFPSSTRRASLSVFHLVIKGHTDYMNEAVQRNVMQMDRLLRQWRSPSGARPFSRMEQRLLDLQYARELGRHRRWL